MHPCLHPTRKWRIAAARRRAESACTNSTRQRGMPSLTRRVGAAIIVLALLERSHEGSEVLLFLTAEPELEDQIEELDGIFERQAAAVVQVRRAVLDTAKRE